MKFTEESLEQAVIELFRAEQYESVNGMFIHKEMSDVLGQLSLMKFEHEEIIDRFHLLYQLDNGTWTVYETFLLGEDL